MTRGRQKARLGLVRLFGIFLGRSQFSLGLLAFGDVLARTQGANDVALIVAQHRIVPGDEPLFAIAVYHRIFDVFVLLDFTRQNPRKHRFDDVPLIWRQEVVEPAFADDFVFFVSQYLTAALVNQSDGLVRGQCYDHDTGHIQILLRPIALSPHDRLSRLPLRYVFDGKEYQGWFIGPGNHLAGVQHQPFAAGCGKILVHFVIFKGFVTRNNVFQQSLQCGDIPLAVCQIVDRYTLRIRLIDFECIVKGLVRFNHEQIFIQDQQRLTYCCDNRFGE